MKNKILQKFLGSNIKIKSLEKLNKYIDFCLINNKDKRIKFETSHHHILPKSIFKSFRDLRENPWNGAHFSIF